MTENNYIRLRVKMKRSLTITYKLVFRENNRILRIYKILTNCVYIPRLFKTFQAAIPVRAQIWAQ